MATTYSVLRMEITKDREGRDEVFVQTEIYDDVEGIIHVPRWYQGDMAKSIIEDNKKTSPQEKDKALHDHIKSTLQAHVQTAKYKREKEEREANKPS